MTEKTSIARRTKTPLRHIIDERGIKIKSAADRAFPDGPRGPARRRFYGIVSGRVIPSVIEAKAILAAMRYHTANQFLGLDDLWPEPPVDEAAQ